MALPAIAIVGRPNVGKSTLFNRLVGRRQAIVYEQPGTTRDRIYGEMEREDRVLTFIDTGGLEIGPRSEISKKIKAQIEKALEEADGIIFVTDVADGLTPQDQEIAEILRRQDKPVFLAVNKVDAPKRESQVAEFHRLGLGEPLPISAYHGPGTEEMMAKICEVFPESKREKSPSDIMKLAIVGRPNVGKSTLLNSLLGEERAIVNASPGTTRDSFDAIVDTPEGPIILIDMAGIRRRGRIKAGIEKYSVLRAMDSVERSDIVLLLLDASEGPTAQDEHIAGFALKSYKGLMVAVNKWDLLSQAERSELKKNISRSFKFLPTSPLLFISALYGKGLNRIFPEARKIYLERKKIVSPEELKKVFNKALKLTPPSGKGTRRLAIFSIKQTGIEPPAFTIEANDSSLIHFSYVRYLENKLREAFGFEGTAIRLLFKKRFESAGKKNKASGVK